jgi:hypothetical protein
LTLLEEEESGKEGEKGEKKLPPADRKLFKDLHWKTMGKRWFHSLSMIYIFKIKIIESK